MFVDPGVHFLVDLGVEENKDIGDGGNSSPGIDVDPDDDVVFSVDEYAIDKYGNLIN